jgi:hypothetical protein
MSFFRFKASVQGKAEIVCDKLNKKVFRLVIFCFRCLTVARLPGEAAGEIGWVPLLRRNESLDYEGRAWPEKEKGESPVGGIKRGEPDGPLRALLEGAEDFPPSAEDVPESRGGIRTPSSLALEVGNPGSGMRLRCPVAIHESDRGADPKCRPGCRGVGLARGGGTVHRDAEAGFLIHRMQKRQITLRMLTSFRKRNRCGDAPRQPGGNRDGTCRRAAGPGVFSPGMGSGFPLRKSTAGQGGAPLTCRLRN